MKICDVCRQSGKYEDSSHVVSVGVYAFDLCNEHLQSIVQQLQQPPKAEQKNPAPDKALEPPARPEPRKRLSLRR